MIWRFPESWGYPYKSSILDWDFPLQNNSKKKKHFGDPPWKSHRSVSGPCLLRSAARQWGTRHRLRCGSSKRWTSKMALNKMDIWAVAAKPWLVDDFGGFYYPLYTGDCNKPRTGNPELNQPGFNGIREGFCGHCSYHTKALDFGLPKCKTMRLNRVNSLLPTCQVRV